jgi:translocation and assembly module TamB
MDTTQAPAAAPIARRIWRRWVLVLAGAVLTLGAAWWWSGSAGSLASTLQLVTWLMPSGQSWRSERVEGSLRHGGQIGQWHWQKAALQVQGHNTDVTLDWPGLWHGRLPVTALRIGHLKIDDQNPASAPQPLSALQLPLRIDLPWQVDQLAWAGPPALEISGLNGRYRYDGTAHQLEMQPFEVAQGRYSLQVHLQAASPMALKAAVQGQVHTPATTRTRALVLAAQASLTGTLAGEQAALALQANVHPASLPASGAGMHMLLHAQIHPWQQQSITQAEADWQQLNLAALWPGAPQTQLAGHATVKPLGPNWQIQARVSNQSPGPWDKARLPLSQLNIQLQRGGDALWQVQQLQAGIAGGQVQGQGQQTAAGWTGVLQLNGIRPEQLHSALSGGALRGQIQAQATKADTVSVLADLNAERSNTSNAGPLRWDKLHLQGQWQATQWDVQALDIAGADARVQGQFTFKPTSQAVQGKIQWQLPGLKGHAEGLWGPQDGQGQAQIDMNHAAQSLAWLQRWPAAAQSLQGWQAAGSGQLQAQWQGGHQQAQTRVHLNLSVPQLSVQQGHATAWQLQQSQITVQGTLPSLQGQIEARLQHGAQSLQLQTQLSAASTLPWTGPWQGQIEQASTRISPSAKATPWKAQLVQPVSWQWSSDPLTSALQWGAGQLQLQGPTPGQAQLHWRAGQWRSNTRNARAAPAQESVEMNAQIQDLPLSWAPEDWVPELPGDVLLQGQFKLEQSQSLRLSAVLERSQGDLRIQSDEAKGQPMRAGLRQARIELQVDNAQVLTRLQWSSEQLGQLQAQAQTRLSHDLQGWHWPEDAPVSGRLNAQLPRIGAWSLLAPPGWRVQGTLDTQLELSGTRQNPQWQGLVQADKLAVRSAVQGIEFSQGQLRARVNNQQVDLEQFSLRGAGSQGGELQTQGQLVWLPAALGAGAANTSPLGHVNMTLQMQAKALRVSNRADRRLAITGQVKAQMKQGQLQLRGQVQADQGLFILPEDSTPTLGEDVVVIDKRKTTPDAATPAASPSWIGIPDVQVTLDLGPDFQIQGMGLSTRLVGKVHLLSDASTKGQPRLSGEVHTEGGRYKAYGQHLNIETGLLRFNGPYDNPLLEILAIRPNLTQRVGVRISGSTMAPKVRLYSDPELPDEEKLAWLILGRSGANGGTESAVLQQAALTLFSSNGKTLGSEMANALGLDEIYLANGSRSDTTATGTALTLGKRLSKDFYLVYETSLRGTFGSFYVFYDLSRRLTLRAQTGQDNALDLIYTVRKD